MEPTTLLFETSPYGSVDAIVEADDRTVYFYLNGSPPFGTRACWVRNLIDSGWTFDTNDLAGARPPVLPRIHHRTGKSTPLPSVSELRITWLAEGNGAALWEGPELLAFIPPWSGVDGFHGYARDCGSDNQVCSPFPPSPHLRDRIDFCDAYWQRWRERPPFAEYQTRLLQLAGTFWGPVGNYYAIDGQTFPPRGLAEFSGAEGPVLLTIGLGLCPMPWAELHVDNPAEFRRVELAVQLPPEFNPAERKRAIGRLSSLAGWPWRELHWLRPGDTCDWLADTPTPRGKWIRGGNGSRPDWPPELTADGDPIHLLWLEPHPQ